MPLLIWIEFALLYVVPPFVLSFGWVPVPVIFLMIGGFGYAATVYRVKYERSFVKFKIPIRPILIRFAFVAPVLLGLTFFIDSELVFHLVSEKPEILPIIVLWYPLISVLPQEFLFRVFFFRRYREIFSNDRVFIGVNIFAFTWVHLIYLNPVALVLSLIGGAIFTWNYWKTRSFVSVFLEHSLYGIWIFIVGLGDYFYINLFEPL